MTDETNPLKVLPPGNRTIHFCLLPFAFAFLPQVGGSCHIEILTIADALRKRAAERPTQRHDDAAKNLDARPLIAATPLSSLPGIAVLALALVQANVS